MGRRRFFDGMAVKGLRNENLVNEKEGDFIFVGSLLLCCVGHLIRLGLLSEKNYFCHPKSFHARLQNYQNIHVRYLGNRRQSIT
jgi:hypothetical protein